MKRLLYSPFAVPFLILLFSCSSHDLNPPVIPSELSESGITESIPAQGQTHLWGFYEISIGIDGQGVVAISNRTAMFAVNVVSFINNNPANLGFNVNSITPGPDYIDVDIDVTIGHPFPGMSDYDGYDVRGIFMGDGSAELTTGGVFYPEAGTDQFMLPDPLDDNGGPDGYSRWFNLTEFGSPGLFGYTPGAFASPGFAGDATLCPYRYYADDLGTNDNLWGFLTSTAGNGVFSAGSLNTRNYYLRFPNSTGVKYGYAIIASWESETTHPANAVEAVGCDLDVTPSLYYVDPGDYGGNLILEISIFDWHSEYTGGSMTDYNIILESTVLDLPYMLGFGDMTPASGGEHYSTYQVDIPSGTINGTNGNELWIIVEYPDADYSNDFNVPNAAENENLAAFFRYDLDVANEPVSGVICDIEIDPSSPAMPYTGPPTTFTFDASDSFDVLGGAITFEWDFDNDGQFGDSYDSGTDDIPSKIFTFDNQEQVCVRVSNGVDDSTCCVQVDIDVLLVNKNIALREGFDAMDIAVDHADGDLLVLYSDGSVWRYTEGGDYQDGVQLYLTYEPGSQYIDIAPNSFSVVGFYEYNSADVCKMYDDTGGFISSGYISSQCWVHDVIGWTGNTYTNMMGVTTFSCPGGTWFTWKMHGPPTYDINNYFYASLYPTQEGCGPGTFDRDASISAECGNITMQWVYYIEGNAPGCNEYRVQRVYRPSGSTLINEAMWGGTRTDDIAGFWDPKDISRDSDNDFYILDELTTGDPLVKKYTEDGDPIGSFGDTNTISGVPLRIEGSDYVGPNGNLMFILHNGSPADLLSVFYPSEIPD